MKGLGVSWVVGISVVMARVDLTRVDLLWVDSLWAFLLWAVLFWADTTRRGEFTNGTGWTGFPSQDYDVRIHQQPPQLPEFL